MVYPKLIGQMMAKRLFNYLCQVSILWCEHSECRMLKAY